jgi:hypothetical protein
VSPPPQAAAAAAAAAAAVHLKKLRANPQKKNKNARARQFFFPVTSVCAGGLCGLITARTYSRNTPLAVQSGKRPAGGLWCRVEI